MIPRPTMVLNSFMARIYYSVINLALFIAISYPVLGKSLEQKEFRIRGGVICLDGGSNPEPCSQESNRFAIESKGETYFFLPEDNKVGIFRDSRVRAREIEVRGWLREKNTIEIIKVFSVVNEQLFEIQYFCSVCNITAFVGGVCWCCQEDFEFQEVPVDGP